MKEIMVKQILIMILLVAAVARFTYLDRIPSGFIPEEASTGWNAYSLSKTGRDEWGKFLPTIFKETGGFKLALNSYLIVPVMYLFGVNEFAVRFPTALAGVITVFLTYFLVLQLYDRKDYALAASFFLSISPWHVSMGRYAVDVNLGIPLFLAGLIFLLRSKTNPVLLIVAAIFFGFSYYTYFNYVVFTFLFVFFMLIKNRKLIWDPLRKKFGVLFLLIQVIFITPYILKPNLIIRYNQATSVNKIGIVNRIHEHREACVVTYPLLLCRFLYNRPISYGLEFMRNYINHYSTTPLYLYGSQLGLSGMPDRWGFFYLFEFPLLIYGIVVMAKRRLFVLPITLWLFLYAVPSSLAAEAHIWRMLTLLPLPQIMSGIGVIELSRRLNYSFIRLVFVGIVCFFIMNFLVDYASYFPYKQSANSYYGFRSIYNYISKIENNYDTIVVAPTGLGFKQLYIYYLFYIKPDPRKFQLGVEVDRQTRDEGWVDVSRIGKWRFVDDVRNISSLLPNRTLVVGDGVFKDTEPLKVSSGNILLPQLLYTIYYPNGEPAFKIVEFIKE